MRSIIAAVVQSRPRYGDLPACMDQAAEWIGEAATRGAKVVALGETWLPGYPAWLDVCPGACLWDEPATKAAHARLVENSIEVDGEHTRRLAQMAGDRGISVIIGVQERVSSGPGNRTLYNSLLTFSTEGKLVNHHRKLMPTYTERLVWGQGDGRGLRAVRASDVRVGGLICWEHWMPLARQALHNSGEDIHVAVWPTVKEMCLVASRHYAFEGRCFVLVGGLLMHVDDLPEGMAPMADVPDDGLIVRGGSAIIGPDGAVLAGPLGTQESVLVAELDLSLIHKESMSLDVSGHYSRPDVFKFKLRK